jgi:murein DD-endopeptidase MepM/ murein hydrolase activator NlpD
LTSVFGGRTNPIKGGHEQHDGIDLAVKRGTRVFAIAPGKVIETGWHGGLGNVVVVRHDDGSESTYAHNSLVLVSPGDSVTRDTALALSGSTGFATGPHLHLEVRRSGKAFDPVPLLTAARARLGG